MKETGVKIHVPPPSVNRDEITIAGDKEGVQLAIDSIKQIYTKMVCLDWIYFKIQIKNINLNAVKFFIWVFRLKLCYIACITMYIAFQSSIKIKI